MGDVLSLIEQAERTMDADASPARRDGSSRPLHLRRLLGPAPAGRKLGSLGGVMKLLPGMSKEMRQAADQIDDREIGRVEAIVRSMTPPSVPTDAHRRFAARPDRQGSGSSTGDVNQLLKQFKEMQKMMKGFGGGAMAQAGGLGKLGGMLGGRRGAMAGLSPPRCPGPTRASRSCWRRRPQARGGRLSRARRPGRLPWRHQGCEGSGKKKKKGGRVTRPSPAELAARPEPPSRADVSHPRGRGALRPARIDAATVWQRTSATPVAREQWRKELVAVKLRLVRMGKKSNRPTGSWRGQPLPA